MKKSIPLATENKTAAEWLVWLRNYNSCPNPRPLTSEECLALRDAIINPAKGYERVAQEFFFVTLLPMVKGFAYKIKSTYNESLNPLDIATTIYREFWTEGSFARLSSYKGDCSIFGWVSQGASQVVFAELEKLGVIKTNCGRTAKNTSLRLKSMAAHPDELMAVLDLVEEPLWHDLLVETYVNRTPSDEVMKMFNFDGKTLSKTLVVAEATLKDQLIAAGTILWRRSEAKKGSKKGSEGVIVNLVTLALGDVSGKLNTTSSEDAIAVAINNFQDSDIYDYVVELLPAYYPNQSPEAMWHQFVVDQAKTCKMSAEQYAVWTASYIDKESPTSIAARLGMRRSNVDNLYSRATKKLVTKIQSWIAEQNR